MWGSPHGAAAPSGVSRGMADRGDWGDRGPRARPEVAPYPFTTLMPNLGVMSVGAGPADQAAPLEDWELEQRLSEAPVLADLPGLIAGAHEVCCLPLPLVSRRRLWCAFW